MKNRINDILAKGQLRAAQSGNRWAITRIDGSEVCLVEEGETWTILNRLGGEIFYSEGLASALWALLGLYGKGKIDWDELHAELFGGEQ
tara:strand:- start:53 stop:319 length:267 start_codon:yes stop_codon:yes gene_type:complete